MRLIDQLLSDQNKSIHQNFSEKHQKCQKI